MNKKIFLHIGRHKTGTSSIQYFLDRNTEYLSQHGYYFLKLGRDQKIANHNLATVLNPKLSSFDRMTEFKTAFIQEIESREEEFIVLSSEGFQNIRDIVLLIEFFKDVDLTVICYLRESLSYKQSSYCQSVHATGYYGRFIDYATSYKLNYQRFVNLWTEVADNLVLALYQRASLVDGDVVVDFMSRLGLDIRPSLSSLETIHNNPSIGGNLLYFKLLMNLTAEGTYKPRSHYSLLQSIAREDHRYRGKFCVSDEDADAIRHYDSASNSFLSSQFPEVQFERFFDYPPLPDRDSLVSDIDRFLEHEELADVVSPLSMALVTA